MENHNKDVVVISFMQRKLEKLVKIKQETTQSPRKKTKKTTSSLGKNRKTLHISTFYYSNDEKKEMIVEQVFGEGRKPTSKKAWKPKNESLNMPIIEKDNFVQLNKYYDLYSNNDR